MITTEIEKKRKKENLMQKFQNRENLIEGDGTRSLVGTKGENLGKREKTKDTF